MTLAEVVKAHILRVLRRHDGDKRRASAELGISLKTLYNKLHRYERETQARPVKETSNVQV